MVDGGMGFVSGESDLGAGECLLHGLNGTPVACAEVRCVFARHTQTTAHALRHPRRWHGDERCPMLPDQCVLVNGCMPWSLRTLLRCGRRFVMPHSTYATAVHAISKISRVNAAVIMSSGLIRNHSSDDLGCIDVVRRQQVLGGHASCCCHSRMNALHIYYVKENQCVVCDAWVVDVDCRPGGG